MTDLNELQFFAQVAKEQSFTMAAKRLDVPKSSVSRAVQSLENRLGLRLITRTTRRVALTEAGAIYLERCHRVLEEAELADDMMGALQAKPRGRLRIGAPAMFVRAILGRMLGEFMAHFPDLRVHLKLIGGEESGRENDFDVVIRAGPLEDSGLLAKPLLEIRTAAYASPGYLADHEPPDSPDALRLHRCITVGCGPQGEQADSALWRLGCGTVRREVRVTAHASVPDPVVSRQLAIAGVGITLLSQPLARADVERGHLVRVLPDWEPDPVELHAVYPSPLHSSPKVRVFLQFLREYLQAQAPLKSKPVDGPSSPRVGGGTR